MSIITKMKLIEINWSRFIGCYLLCIAMLQVYIYLQIADSKDLFFYLDPRIGIYFFLERILDKFDLVIIELLTAGWMIIIALFFIIGKAPIKTYVISELFLSAPSIIFFASVVGMSAVQSHGFSIIELICPVIMMTVTTIIPLGIVFKHSR